MLTEKSWPKIALIPVIIGGVISGVIMPTLWFIEVIPQWSLMLGIIPLVVGGFLTVVFRSMEYKPNEPSTKCVRCGYDVYVSSRDEHLKLCEGKN